VPTSSSSLDRVVRSVSVSEQSDESGTHPWIRRPPSSSNPRLDSRPGIRRQASNPAMHGLSAPGPHRGSRGTYGVVPRPEGSGEDGVLPGKQGVFGGRSPPLMHEQSAPSQPRQWTLCSAGPPPTASRPPPPEGGGLLATLPPRPRRVRAVSVLRSDQGVAHPWPPTTPPRACPPEPASLVAPSAHGAPGSRRPPE